MIEIGVVSRNTRSQKRRPNVPLVIFSVLRHDSRAIPPDPAALQREQFHVPIHLDQRSLFLVQLTAPLLSRSASSLEPMDQAADETTMQVKRS
ncbi:hypothetical protein Cob_v008216 [Colletotrichum orbiculare MAFF 240422]|uniref:Uncharacterized protein n=1 Tax=Colletotrichum orbiculare (strain 104-T / ATCC 96160 / CBS 514.97 / LARS 414 / MAFF 240422) TaxID=1213857 RepID=A0A484FLJ2_COLOR|nr:hypothetical protein Cob_v008216 [Colletotrichum orbiculare MAFF 240422]